MRVYTYSQARQSLAELLDRARREEVAIRRKSGDVFIVALQKRATSPFDVPAIQTRATTEDIVAAVRDSREMAAQDSHRTGPGLTPQRDERG